MSTSRTRSRNRSRTPPPRPTTPLRPNSRSSFRASTSTNAPHTSQPLDSLEPQFAELSDSLSDLESNLLHLQLMHESLSRFSENFAAFLYGLEMNAFVVDWPEQPLVESVARWRAKQRGAAEGETTMGVNAARTPTRSVNYSHSYGHSGTTGNEVDSTLLSETTFASLKATPARRRTLAPEEGKMGGTASRGRGGSNIGRGGNTGKSGLPNRSESSAGTAARGARGGRGTGLPTRGRGRGAK